MISALPCRPSNAGHICQIAADEPCGREARWKISIDVPLHGGMRRAKVVPGGCDFHVFHDRLFVPAANRPDAGAQAFHLCQDRIDENRPATALKASRPSDTINGATFVTELGLTGQPFSTSRTAFTPAAEIETLHANRHAARQLDGMFCANSQTAVTRLNRPSSNISEKNIDVGQHVPDQHQFRGVGFDAGHDQNEMNVMICLSVNRSSKAANCTTKISHNRSPNAAGLSSVHFFHNRLNILREPLDCRNGTAWLQSSSCDGSAKGPSTAEEGSVSITSKEILAWPPSPYTAGHERPRIPAPSPSYESEAKERIN